MHIHLMSDSCCGAQDSDGATLQHATRMTSENRLSHESPHLNSSEVCCVGATVNPKAQSTPARSYLFNSRCAVWRLPWLKPPWGKTYVSSWEVESLKRQLACGGLTAAVGVLLDVAVPHPGSKLKYNAKLCCKLLQ